MSFQLNIGNMPHPSGEMKPQQETSLTEKKNSCIFTAANSRLEVAGYTGGPCVPASSWSFVPSGCQLYGIPVPSNFLASTG